MIVFELTWTFAPARSSPILILRLIDRRLLPRTSLEIFKRKCLVLGPPGDSPNLRFVLISRLRRGSRGRDPEARSDFGI